MTESTEKLIRELADKLGTTAEHLWGVLIKQAAVEGWTSLTTGFALIVLIIVSFWWTRKQIAAKRWNWSEDKEGAWLIWGFIALLMVVAVILELSRVPTCFLNPEYWALKQIIN